MLQLHQISKTFPGVRALSGVSFSIEQGEVHAVCGENGAGKSTLMNILAGHLQPDEGSHITINQQVSPIEDFNQVRSLGIAIVHQECNLIDTLSIAENIFINQTPVNRWGWIDFSQMYRLTKPILSRLDLGHLKPTTLVSELSPAHKTLVEIGKALAQEPKILILDEPTASLTEKETETLFQIILELKQNQVSIIYISHRLAEIFLIADKVTVLKDGKYQGTSPIGETSPQLLIQAMVGREINTLDKPARSGGVAILEVDRLSGPGFHDCSFSVHEGQILALAGLIGAGRTEIARVIFGMNKKTSGRVYFKGEEVQFNHPAEAITRGLGYVPEDRKLQGLFLTMSVQDNILSVCFSGNRWIEKDRQRAMALKFIDKLRIQTPSPDQPVQFLSGGNQQKCLLARWLQIEPALLIVDEPTHGIDVGTKFEIYQLLLDLAAKGTAILLISSELPEVLALADRITVLRLGRVAGSLKQAEASEEKILELAASGNSS